MSTNDETKEKFTVGADSDIEDDIRIDNLYKARDSFEKAREVAKKKQQRVTNIITWIGIL